MLNKPKRFLVLGIVVLFVVILLINRLYTSDDMVSPSLTQSPLAPNATGNEGLEEPPVNITIPETVPPDPSIEEKKIFFELMPTVNQLKLVMEYTKEYTNATDFVWGIEPFFFTEEEIDLILNRAEELKTAVPGEIILEWGIPRSTTKDYAKMLAKKLSNRSEIVIIIMIIVERENVNETLDIVMTFIDHNLRVWIKSIYIRSKWVKVPKDISPDELRLLLLGLYEKGKQGKVIPGVEPLGYGEGNWNCSDPDYYGKIKVYNYYKDWKWWYLFCSQPGDSGCEQTAPSESSACDIHYMREMPFYRENAITWGLIDFPGCKEAPDCGTLNTLWKGKNELTFSKLPLNKGSFVIYACYMLTNPCPYTNYCCCYHDENCYDQQMFIVDIIYVYPRLKIIFSLNRKGF